MKRTLFGILLLAGIARADGPAIRLDATCGAYASDGVTLVTGPGVITLTPAPGGVGKWVCKMDQGFPAYRRIVWNYANTGQTCSVGQLAGDQVRSSMWEEVISSAGRITVTCIQNPGTVLP